VRDNLDAESVEIVQGGSPVHTIVAIGTGFGLRLPFLFKNSNRISLNGHLLMGKERPQGDPLPPHFKSVFIFAHLSERFKNGLECA
jgi:hypothetical protein